MNMFFRTRYYAHTAVIGLSILLLWSACKTKTTENTINSFQVIQPQVKDTVIYMAYVAQINAVQNVEIRSRNSGFLEKLWVDEGQPVKQGQVLFSISSKEFQQQLIKAQSKHKAAKAELKASKISLENAKILLEKDIISRAEYALSEAQTEGLQANVENAAVEEEEAALRLSFSEIKAPFDGVLNRIQRKPGSLIEEGELLTHINDNREVLAYFNISEKEYLDLAHDHIIDHNDTIRFIMANGEPFPHIGFIEVSESEFDQETGNIAFRARFPNPNALLKHGSNGKVQIEKDVKNALLIPKKSTFEIQDKIYVFVVHPDNSVEQRNIKVSLRFPHSYAVESGLSADEYILYEGIDRVRNGDKINPIKK